MVFQHVLDHVGVVVIEILGNPASIVVHDGVDSFARLFAGIDQDLGEILDVALLPYAPTLQVEEEDVAIRVVAHAFPKFEIEQIGQEIHWVVVEDAPIHGDRLVDDRLEVHLSQYVLLDIDPPCQLYQLETAGRQLEHAAFGHIDHRLRAFQGE